MSERVISADSHILLLDERVLAHLPARYHDDYESCRGAHRRPGATPSSLRKAKNTVAGPSVPAAGRPGEWEPRERLKDMDIDGVDAEVLYTDPTGGAAFYQLSAEAGVPAMQAFNSAALEFASVDPERLLPVYLLPIHDVPAAIAELQRIATAGARAVQIPLYPGDAGLPLYYDEVYEPLWSAIEGVETPVSLHVCPPKGRNLGRDPTPARGIFQVMPPILMSHPMVELILSGVFTRHPKLRVVLVEAGLGWIPYMLDRLDRNYRKNRWKERGMPLEEVPSFYWHRNMGATFEEDELGLNLRDHIGVENLLWATDYPHPDSTWPESQKVIEEQFARCTRDEMRKMVSENAARLYRL